MVAVEQLARWRDLFEANGYTSLAPGWPDDPASVAEAYENPEVFADKMVQQVTDHYLNVISQLDRKPVVIGHSFGGLIVQKIAGEGVSAVTVAIDNAPFRGVLPLPISALKSASPVLGNPANHGKAIALTLDQFKYGWANNLDDAEAKELYETFHVPASGGAHCSRRRSRTSTRSAGKRSWITKTPSVDRCSLSRATAITRFRWRSPMPPTRFRPRTPVSPGYCGATIDNPSPHVQTRLGDFLAVGLQQHGEFELNLADQLAQPS